MKVYTLSEWNKRKKKKNEEANNTGELKVYSYDEWAEKKGVQPITSKKDDIAPVRESTSGRSMVSNPEGQKDSYLQKGALSGGVSLKNISTSLKATEADMEEDATKGILGLGERIWDGFVTLAPYVAQADYYRNGGGYNVEADKIFNDAIEKSKQSAATYVAKDLIDEEKIAKRIVTEPFEKKTGINMEASSFIGSKGDSLVQSASDMLARQGLNYVVPGAGLALTGLSSLGGETENAFNQGAKYEDAVLSGFISATAEVGTEKIAGIKFGGKTLTDGVAKSIAKRASKEFLGTLAKWGFNTVGEGAEEVLSGYATAIGQKLTYMNDKEISELFSKEDAKEEFFAGAILGGMFEAGSVAASGLKGTDYVTELDKNEKQVIDAVYNEMLAEKETEGKKLTQSEKSKLYDSVEKAVEKGYIDIETIEKTLGGDTYKAYKNASDSEDALKKEYEELGNTSNPTLAQTARYNELSQKIKDLETTSNKGQLKDQMSKEVFEKVKNTRLIESYNEQMRKNQAFEADLESYTNESAKQTVKNFMEQTKSNNSNRAHDFVDMLTKVSEDRGHVFEFMTTVQLEESIKNGNQYDIDVDPNKIEAFIHKKSNRIVINMDANKSLRSLVGHEVSHTFEKANGYDKMQEVLFKYAEMKGEYADRLASVERRYGKDDVNYELTADLLGDYIMGDTDFINSLSTENPGILKRIYNEIKYLYKMATAGSAEARQFEKVKREIERAWRESASPAGAMKVNRLLSDAEVNEILEKNGVPAVHRQGGDVGLDSFGFKEDGTIKYSLADSDGNQLTKEQQDFFKDSKVRDENGNLKVMYHGTPNAGFTEFKSGTYFTEHKWYADRYKSQGASSLGYKKTANNPDTYAVYLNIEKPFDTRNPKERKIFENEYYGQWGMGTPLMESGLPDWMDGEDLKEFIEEKGYDYDGLILDEGAVGGYGDEVKSRGLSYVVFSPNQVKNVDNQKPTNDSDIRYSLSEDNKGNKLSEGQKEYFKDSKIVDPKGYLKVMYHGTPNEFTVFNPMLQGGKNGTAEGYGIYFTDSEEVTKSYGDKRMSGYLNVTHPARADRKTIKKGELVKLLKATTEVEAKQYVDDGDYDNVKDALRDTWISNYVDTYSSTINEAYIECADSIISMNDSDMSIIQEVMGGMAIRDYESAYKFYDILKSTIGIDGFITEWNSDLLPENKAQIVVAFDSNQFKDLGNQNPTDNPDINLRLADDAQYTSKSNEAFPIYAKDLRLAEETQTETEIAPITQMVDETTNEAEEFPIKTTADKLNEKQKNLQTELDNVKALREQARQQKQDKINSLQATYDALKNKDTKKANALKLRIEKQKRIASDIDSTYEKRIDTITKRQERIAKEQQKDHANKDRLERAYAKIDRELAYNISKLEENFDARRKEIASELESESAFISNKASEIYDEITHIRKGVRASEELGYLLDMGFGWEDIKKSLLRVSHSPTKVVTKDSACESVCREVIEGMYMDRQAELESLDAEYETELAKLEAEAESARDEARVATQRRVKGQEYTDLIKTLVGNTSTWVDKKLGIKYKINTLKRNLRDIVRDENGKHDIAKADAIYNELEGKYDHNEALLKKESRSIKQPYAEMKITKAEDKYIQMLGEFRHNPSTTLTEDDVKEFYEKNKSSINAEKVDKIIEDARATYDSLLERVNEVLHEQGMQEIPYRKGYFPHFTDEKQSFLAKLFNWKTINTEIPTSIAGLTEEFNPNRSWQSFNKQRKSDDTDYSFMKGLDTYVHGALDWIYHIEDIQKRRALENHIRYTHSPEKVQREIDRLIAEDKYDADTLQDMINGLYAEANNPLNNFVTDLRIGTNNLANKKDSMDRGMEAFTNRKFYSTMTNLSNRVTANHVAGSISSALTNFIPITQSWGEVSPVTSLQAMKDTMKSALKDDGIVEKSDFLTNRLMEEENLYKTKWDKANEAVTFLMTAADSFTSQTVWRSKYIDNISKGMSENEAIKNADEFAKGLIAGRSRGNMPTIFNAKNPLIKVLTAFQLEVNNHYGYMFKDMPQAMKDEGTRKLVGGYVKMFLGAYAYNALYSSLTGRDAAFDPIGIVEDLLRDLGMFGEDDEEEPVDALLNLTENITDELPFIGGLLGGGRIPIASALPYGEGIVEAYTETAKDISDKDWTNLTKEWMNPFYYLAMPMGGGQLRKTVQGLSMFDDDLPIAGSYTDGGNLRFPVDDTIKNRVQAGLFGQYASENAREYFDRGEAPLKEKQIQELVDLDLPIRDYWDYRKGLKEQNTLEEKFEYVAGQDVSDEQKNIMINNVNGVSNRKEKVDISNYDDFADYEEFDFYSKHKEKYNFLKDNHISYSEYISDEETKGEYDKIYDWYKKNPNEVTLSKAVTDNVIEYKRFTSELNDIRADKDANGNSISGSAKDKKIDYINGLDLDYGQKIILFRTYYDSKDDKETYNADIVDYLNSREDLSYDEIVTILTELDFTVHPDGTVEW